MPPKSPALCARPTPTLACTASARRSQRARPAYVQVSAASARHPRRAHPLRGARGTGILTAAAILAAPATLAATGILAATAILVFAPLGTARAATITDPGQAPVVLPAGPTEGEGLSGIGYQAGDGWLLVSDYTSPNPRVFRATIDVDLATGEIIGTPSLDSDLLLGAGTDTEGVAPTGDGHFLVSDEVGPAIYRFDAGGTLEGSLAIPDVFTSGLRGNLGFESLALGPDGSVWTANEEALRPDGPVSSFTKGTIVRIQRFDDSLAPAGQWGYVTEQIPGDITASGAGRDIERSGVVDMAVLPDGTVLVLERAFGGDPGSFGLPIFEIRIYEIDLTGATDTSSMAGLSIGSFTPAEKVLLWADTFTLGTGLADFEGIALGPRALNGDLVAILVADDNGGSSRQVLKSLRVTASTPSVPNPGGSEADPGDQPTGVAGQARRLSRGHSD